MKKIILFILLFSAAGFSQVTVAPITNPRVVFLNAAGAPCAACQLDTFAAGTTTPLATYSDLGVTLNANPIVLGSDGSATVYLTSASYKFRLRGSVASGGATIWTQDNITWSTPLSTFSGLTDAGNFTQSQPTLATNVANQSSFTDCMVGNYWTGAASAADQWCFQNILGSGSNPTSTFTLTHTGSSGTTAINFPPLTFSNITETGTTTGQNANYSGNVTVAGTLGVTGDSTLSGNVLASSGKCLKWNSDTGICRDAAAAIDFGNGTPADKTATINAGAANLSGLVTTKGINGTLVVGSGTGQFSSMASCYSTAVAGQTCLVSPNWSETFGSQLVMSKNNVGFYFMGAASINMSTFGILVNDGVIGAYLNSPSAFGGAPTDTGSGTPVTLSYNGSGDAIAAGTVGGSNGVLSFGLQNINIDISGGTSAVGFHGFCINHSFISGLSIIGTNSANTQTGIKLADCGTNGEGANALYGIQIIRPKFGIQISGNGRENDFGMLRMAGQTTPIAGSIGFDFQGTAKNNFIHGGFISGYITGINFGGTSNFNDIHIEEDLDSGGGGANDAVFGSGTFNNEIVRTSDIGAYVFTDSGNGNCIRNTASTCVVKRIDLTGQNNNIGSTLLFAVPANSTLINQGGMYRVSGYTVVTTAAGTSSTLPNLQITWTDNDTNVVVPAINITASSSGNTVGTTNGYIGIGSAGAGAAMTINVKPGTNINYQTVNYASNAANAMQYAVHIKVEYLGQ